MAGAARAAPASNWMSFSHRILLGLIAGVAVGVFLGEYAVALKWVADGFVKLLQMTVLPYVTLSIVTSLGSLNYTQARMLGMRAGAVLVLLWAIGLTFAFLIPVAFPDVESAMFFSTALIERRQPFNFVDLYIPSNPFNSLANNVVPAVVLFSVVVGVALIGVERKEALLDVLRTASQAVSRVTHSIVRLTPYGLFAIAASAAGTLGIEQLGRLQVYLITYVAVALLLSLWVLPGLIAALTPIRIREVFSLTRDALITAFVAGDLFIVLPGLIDASRTLLVRHTPASSDAAELPDVLVPTSFNFPHTGKLLSLSFILFAGWFADAVMPLRDYPQLALTGLLTFFGSLNAAVPFLLDLFRIPADTFQLFLATGVINSRVGALVAAVHTLTVALLGACAITGVLRIQRGPLLRYLAITAVLTTAVLGGARLMFIQVLRPEYTRNKVIASMHLLREPAPATVHKTPPATPPSDSRPVLARLRDRGVLRVGYMQESLPFAFFNAAGNLVGFDIELAHELASELHVSLEFVPVDRSHFASQLAAGCCDIVMSGVAITTLRAATMRFTDPYLDETLAFVVPDHLREQFSRWDSIHDMPAVTIAVPNVPYYIDKLRERLPRAELRVIEDYSRLFEAWDPELEAAAIPAERGSAWTLLHPQFSVVVPEPGIVKVPLAYPIGAHDPEFAAFMNSWIDLKRKDGTMDAIFEYWVLGRSATPRQPRWSVIRNVLHWVD
jgi:Na+/H+-dicarboxylate symporter/ABC-type amino acid transport substrate-binding protein